MNKYKYMAKPRNLINQEIIKKLKQENHIPGQYIIDMNTGEKILNEKYKEFLKKASEETDKEMINDQNRVYKNLMNITLNTIVEITPMCHIQRVNNGLIYIHLTFSDKGFNSSVIHKQTTFVPF